MEKGEQTRLQKAIGERIYVIENRAMLRPELFSAIHRDVKLRFGVDSYKNVKRKDLQDAIRFIGVWKPK